MALNGARDRHRYQALPQREQASQSPAAKDMYPSVSDPSTRGSNHRGWCQCDEENSAMEVLSDCSPGCVLAMEVTLHLDCKFYWAGCVFCKGRSMDRESLLWWQALEVPVRVHSVSDCSTCVLGLHSSLFQRQCEYKLQLFVVLSVCLIMIVITRRVSAWYIACNQGKKNKSCGCCP